MGWFRNTGIRVRKRWRRWLVQQKGELKRHGMQEEPSVKSLEQRRRELMLLIYPRGSGEFKKYKFMEIKSPGEGGGMTIKRIMQVENSEWDNLTEAQQEKARENAYARGLYDIEIVNKIK